MGAQKYLDILRKIKDVAFATVDEYGNPQIRMIDIMIAQDEKLYFITSRGKEFHKQLSLNPNIAITGMTPNYLAIRLNGKAKKAEQSWLTKIFEDNPSMNDVYPGESRFILDVFYIDEGYGEIFDLSDHPIYRENFVLGNANGVVKHLIINETCIECGICKDLCPQQCIKSGTPYFIKQENCLRCGLCTENCPVGAISNREVY